MSIPKEVVGSDVVRPGVNNSTVRVGQPRSEVVAQPATQGLTITNPAAAPLNQIVSVVDKTEGAGNDPNFFLQVSQAFRRWRQRELVQDMINFVNPFFNHFAHEKYYQGRKMDYFGYMAHKITGSKKVIRLEEKICFCIQLVDEIDPYHLDNHSSNQMYMNSNLVSRRFGRLINGGLAYCFTSLIFAPEMINPYYTTYMLNHRFPVNSRPIPTMNDAYASQVMAKLADFGGSAYNYMRDLIVTPNEVISESTNIDGSTTTTKTTTPTQQVVTSNPTTTVVRP